mmetsp:Transcript_20326/g.26341  ORF Transcript_20326/g.26341 Transcript_20326/m.26341 type:complete len:365 (+) Transcript_20326:34-1128(+)
MQRVIWSSVPFVGSAIAIEKKTAQAKKKALSEQVINHPALEHGYPQNSYVGASENFVVSFDYRTRNPQWVMEKLTASNLRKREASRQRVGQFFEADMIPERMRNKLKHFIGSGYDRGHMVPAADLNHSEIALRDSFCLANVSPQIGKGLNRDYWARLEKLARDILLKKGAADELFIITGPLFLPTKRGRGKEHLRYDYHAIGQPPSVISVPTHFYKIILAVSKSRALGFSGAGYALGAFVIPNEAIKPETPLTSFIAPLEAVEAAAGVIFFAELLTPQRRDALAIAEERWLKGRRAQKSRFLLLEQNGDDASSPKAEHIRSKKIHLTKSNHTDITHLCDRHDCELVAVRWLEQFKKSDEEEGDS